MRPIATLPRDDENAVLTRFDGVRGDRYAEVFLIDGDPTGPLTGSIYNTLGLNSPTGRGDTCPQRLLDDLDPAAVAREYGVLSVYLNGPRLWCLDWVEVMAGTERRFADLRARWVMWLDVPPGFSRRGSLAYHPMTGRRDTRFGIERGSPAYVLDDPDGESWVMKSVSLMVDPGLTYAAAAELGDRLDPPRGWRFRSVVLDEDLVLTPHDGTARITQDELGNTYDRVGGPYSTVRP